MRLTSILISILIALLSLLLYRTQLVGFTTLALDRITKQYSNILRNKILPDPSDSSAESSATLNSNSRFYNPSEKLVVTEMSVSRAIRKIFPALEQAEGAGARVRRSIGTSQLRNFSPFLMLDHFNVNAGSGFPDHPHRGQETITYLIHGAVDHEDFAGNAGVIEAGDLQFMTAGRGIMHAEMPRPSADGSPILGLQLWVDLPAKLKKCEPRYRDLRAKEIPNVDINDKVHVKVISGQSGGVDSVKDLAYTPVWILDFEIKPGGKVTQALPVGWNAFSYQLEGTAIFGAGDGRRTVNQYDNCVFDVAGDVVNVEVPEDSTTNARFVLIAGQILDQKIVQYGPFVLNTPEEVRQALYDYQFNINGFERAKDWTSKIAYPEAH
ncbi:RmlC-like cupin domain-containing protein [Xylaria nigripes]|nr:RmlC-like cupin domain-containing protein [Xylaria nigripes]